jgi:hypothetical protein
VALAAFTLVFIVLLFEFGEFAVPVSIFIVNILSLFGVFGALWLTGVTFNISSFVGIIMIIGIVAENAIFVMHNVKAFQADGVGLDAALVRATVLRGRPIVMTTLAAVCALLPLALGVGGGGQMQQPLAIAVIGGFSLSSLLLFFGLPLIYRLIVTPFPTRPQESGQPQPPKNHPARLAFRLPVSYISSVGEMKDHYESETGWRFQGDGRPQPDPHPEDAGSTEALCLRSSGSPQSVNIYRLQTSFRSARCRPDHRFERWQMGQLPVEPQVGE